MKLQGRDLTTGLRGDAVKLLHSELKQLGLSIPDSELTGGLFGDATTTVVKRFQICHQLKSTGIVDEITATAINRDVDALTPPAASLIVKGQVRRSDGTLLNTEKVQAFDKDLRSEESLGEVALDARGDL